MKSWFKTYWRHLAAGLSLAMLPMLYLIDEGTDLHRLDPRQHVIQNTLSYGLLLLFSYVNHTVWVPNLYLARRYRQYAAVVLGCLVGVALLPHRMEQWVFLKPPKNPTLMHWVSQVFWEENLFPPRPDEPPHRRNHPYPPERGNGFPPGPNPDRSPTLPIKLAIILLVGSVSTLTSVSLQTAIRLRQTEAQTLQAELQHLKAQIHPHFLFNTLNSIYALAIRNDDRTATAIVQLAEFMRYMIRDGHRERVALQKELDYLGNYIDLQRARWRDAVAVHFSVEGSAGSRQIAPLILFTFIENAFKHGVNPNVESVIDIRVSIEEYAVRVRVFNRKGPTHRPDDANGVGLPNATERLRLSYPDAHRLRITDTAVDYTVDLTIYVS